MSVMTRDFAMPTADTFSIPVIAELLGRWAVGPRIIDPFARNAKWGTLTNDQDPSTEADFHLDAEEWLKSMPDATANVVLFDPPYSPRQIAEHYRILGRKALAEDTQNARLYKAVKDQLDRILRPGGIAICCGWNSNGFGVGRGYELLELLLVHHGAAHNDTIVTVERKGNGGSSQ